MICAGCHQLLPQVYATVESRLICSRRCLLAWLAAHPDKSDEEGAPE